ncbi:cell division ATP-binding protein FtsE [Candidatus Absconditicoccus praedator]|uniref:cell division ATP-binding protein FtsE n=1 Tax=Candidatus Absconditicoccus praedator TaxID=2735562 RepID=UPI001E41E585|nr:ATP-binding cassette domain-containing protein [Candidatus Absconditicoccus praedator]UFX82985.1 ATP-binding cassette domain-containing protein [Candidatus Absconditicoccus praedator]
MDKENLVEIEDLTWGYPGCPNFIFEKFNFKLDKQDFCFVLGKSGVGKTTLIKFLVRQLLPPKKMIFYKKEDIARFSNKEIQKYRRKIGVIYQDFKLIDYKTVQENIEYPMQIIGQKASFIKKKSNEILYKMNLMDKKTFYPPQLSGGEKQRVSIARALITDPEFIIADEPTGNLDKETSREISDYLVSLNEQGHTILFITHDLELMEYVKKQNKKIKSIKI